jgi:hypothetical protein
MSGTFAPQDFELSPAKVYFTPAGSTAEIYIGATLADVKINFGYKKSPLKADQTGETVLDNRISGFESTVEFEVAQVNDFDLMAKLFPHASTVGGTPFTGTAPSAAVQFNNAMGQSDLSVAGKLRLHPQVFADANKGWDWTFFKATPNETSDFVYGPTKQIAYKIKMQVFPDTSTDPFRFFRRGDTAL